MGDAREVMDALTDAVNAQDFEKLGSLYSTDVVITDPIAGQLTGNIIEFLKTFTDAFPDLIYHSEAAHESGNVAIDEGYVTGTNTGPLALPDGEVIPPTGKSVRLRTCDIVTVENGLCVRHNFYYDQMEMLGQLGLVPESTSVSPRAEKGAVL